MSLVGPLATTGLIFGGCCTNVFALEGVLKYEPGSGLLITFLQFVLATAFAYLTQFDPGSPYTVRRPSIPFRKWVFIAALFFSINMLNNWAFAFNISVPVHIILRSFGSVTTMAAGYLRGKRYSALQVISVLILTLGVLISAWADSESKGKSMSVTPAGPAHEFATGIAILLVAQILSAYQGAYTEDTYAQYRARWTENLFYSHLLSLPLFLPFLPGLRDAYARLKHTSPIGGSLERIVAALFGWQAWNAAATLEGVSLSSWKGVGTAVVEGVRWTPRGTALLWVNAVTQLACISGVSLLAAGSTAVTVTIVLNVRKLASFALSTVLFGHALSPRMLVGAALVFGSGALYGWETSWRRPRNRAREDAKVENKKRM